MPLAPPDPAKGAYRDNSGCQNAVGYVIDLHPADGDAACWLDIGPQHLNRNMLLHGGITAMLLDVACGYVASKSVDINTLAPVLTVSLNMHYVAPASGGRITAISRRTGGGRKLCYVNGELRDGDGQLIASAAGVFKLITKRPKQ